MDVNTRPGPIVVTKTVGRGRCSRAKTVGRGRARGYDGGEIITATPLRLSQGTARNHLLLVLVPVHVPWYVLLDLFNGSHIVLVDFRVFGSSPTSHLHFERKPFENQLRSD